MIIYAQILLFGYSQRLRFTYFYLTMMLQRRSVCDCFHSNAINHVKMQLYRPISKTQCVYLENERRIQKKYKKCYSSECTAKIRVFVQTSLVNRSLSNFACWFVSRMCFLVLSFRKIGRKMWELWGVEISHLSLKRHIAYTTACCYRTSRD